MRFIRLLAVPTPVSLQGLFSYNDCEAAPEILGDWIAHGDLDGTWTLQQLSERKYRLIQQVPDPDSGNKAALDVCVAHLGGDLFLDHLRCASPKWSGTSIRRRPGLLGATPQKLNFLASE